MTIQQFHRRIEEIIEAPAGTIRGDEQLTSLERWDSLAIISFIAMADSECSQSVTADDLQKCRTVAELGALLSLK